MNLANFFPGGVTGWQIVFAIISVVAGWVVTIFARRGVRKLADKTTGISASVGIGVGLAFLGANVRPLLAMTAVGVIVLTLVLRGVADGRTVHVPKAAILSDVLINESRHGARRSDVVVRARSTHDLPLLTVIEVVSVSPTRNVIEVQFWHHPLRAYEVRSAGVRRISEKLASASAVDTVTSRIAATPPPPPATARGGCI